MTSSPVPANPFLHEKLRNRVLAGMSLEAVQSRSRRSHRWATIRRPSIHEGLLQPLLQNAQDPETYPLYALLPPGRHQAPKVRVFLDFLIERLGSAPWRMGVRRSGRVG
jgi:DNA-binding transcriptional LysR family regulator